MTEKLTPLKPYEPNWPHGYCMRDGERVRLLCDDAPGISPIVVINDDGLPFTYSADGQSWPGFDMPDDIMCAAPARADRRYVFIVEDTAGRLSAPWPSRQRAQQHIDECDERFPELSPRKVLRFVQDPEGAE